MKRFTVNPIASGLNIVGYLIWSYVWWMRSETFCECPRTSEHIKKRKWQSRSKLISKVDLVDEGVTSKSKSLSSVFFRGAASSIFHEGYSVYIYIYIYVYRNIKIYIYIYLHTEIYKSIYIHIYIYLIYNCFIYIYIYMYQYCIFEIHIGDGSSHLWFSFHIVPAFHFFVPLAFKMRRLSFVKEEAHQLLGFNGISPRKMVI